VSINITPNLNTHVHVPNTNSAALNYKAGRIGPAFHGLNIISWFVDQEIEGEDPDKC
jgi:hypothetical protein